VRSGGRLLRLGIWLGVVYGLVEAAEVLALSLVPGALSWRTGNSANILWFAPLFYGAVALLPATAVALLARPVPRLPWERILVFFMFAGGAFLALTLPGRVLGDLSAALLALGVASVAARTYRRHAFRIERLADRTLVPLVGGVAITALLVLGTARVREARALAALPVAPLETPNVLLVIIDTQRADHLSSYGYHRPTTPSLDRLAAEGTLFERAYSSSSWTLPAHASLMTGRPLHEHRAGLMRRPYLDERHPTLAEVLRGAGYATGGFVANTFWVGRQTGLDRGFIRYEDFWGNPGDAVARTALGRRLAYDVLPRFGVVVDVPGRKRAAEINRDLLRWVDRLGDRPFFAFVNYFDVHGPYLPPPPFAGRFSGDGARGREKKLDIGALTSDIVVPPPEVIRAMIDGYDESLAYLDAEFGKLLIALEERGILDRTVVIVTSDHGESWGEHGMMYHGHSLYHEQLHVPLIVRYPAAFRAGVRESRAVGIQQIPATILELAGVEAHAFPGESLREGPDSGPLSPPVLAEVGRRSLVAANWPSSRGWLRSLLTGRWQLTEYESGELELFDLEADPAQEHNLAPAAAVAGVLAGLHARLDTLSPASRLDWRGGATAARAGAAAGARTAARSGSGS